MVAQAWRGYSYGVRASLILLAACSGPAAFKPPVASPDQGDTTHAELATDDNFKPSYGKADIEKALIAERGKEASAERAITELEARGSDASDEQLRSAVADLAVRRRFIASLEACQETGRTCPPRLDEPAWTFDVVGTANPPLDVPLRFDLSSWQRVTAELHGRACACRTLDCVDSVGVAIDQVETRPMAEVQGDETASQSLTWARECLFRLRGRAIVTAQHAITDD